MVAGTEAIQLLLVSRNDETMRHLQEYFEARGFNVLLDAALKLPPEGNRPAAVVAFPDEFPVSDVETYLRSLLEEYPGTSLTLVTRDTQRFNEFLGTLDESVVGRFSVLPRPAFSWTILERVFAPLGEHD